MTSLGGKLTVPVCHPTKKVTKAEQLTYLSANNDVTHHSGLMHKMVKH
jgi:hypothetical protein